MNLYCIKCLEVRNNNNIKTKREIDGKVNLHSCSFD